QPRAPNAEFIPSADGISELTSPLTENRILGKDAEIAREHPVLHDRAAPVAVFVCFAEEAVGQKALHRGLILMRDVVIGAVPVINTDAAPDLESDAGPVADRTEACAKIGARVQAVVAPTVVLNAAPTVVPEEGVHSATRTVVAHRT